jgi:uncharacterized SAM-binding protein YcdF (DUF218 family)
MDVVTLSKILPVLILPFFLTLWLILLALVLLFFRRVRGAIACVVAALAICLVCGNPSLSAGLYAHHERTYLPLPPSQYPEADVIIVLGGALSPPLPPRESFDMSGATDRVRHGARLYQAGRADTVLLAGGNVFPQPGVEAESFYMAKLMQEWDVPASAILVEGRSRNTYENALYSKELMEKDGLKTALLVTSALHMPRALAVFRSAGIETTPAPTDYNIINTSQPRVLNWIPTLGAMATFTDVFREHLGILAYRFKGWISDEEWNREN